MGTAAFGWRVEAERVHHNWLRLIRVGASSLTRSLTVSFGCFEALLLDMRLVTDGEDRRARSCATHESEMHLETNQKADRRSPR